MNGWMDEWMDGWMDGFEVLEAVVMKIMSFWVLRKEHDVPEEGSRS
jgi:hypothetical protein